MLAPLMVPKVQTFRCGFTLLCPCTHLPLGALVLRRGFSDAAFCFLVLGRGKRSLFRGGALRAHLADYAPGESGAGALLLGWLLPIACAWLVASLYPLCGALLGLQDETTIIFSGKSGFLGCPGAGSHELVYKRKLSRI